MDLYFSPLACSMATRIALYEAGAEANFLEVDPKTKTVLQDKSDFRGINPLGLVPTLRTDDGVILTENAAILQHVAERFPDANISAKAGVERSRLQQWLCFIGTELHKGAVRAAARSEGAGGGEVLCHAEIPLAARPREQHLEGREFLLDHFSVADAYLATVLNWTHRDPGDRSGEVAGDQGVFGRIQQRPSVMKAVSEEFTLYKAELARHKAA